MDVAFILDKYFKGTADVSIDVFDAAEEYNEAFVETGELITNDDETSKTMDARRHPHLRRKCLHSVYVERR
jgi:hypothetical protein